MRVLLGAFGDAGHAFPVLALGRELAARGHAVLVQTWSRWEADARTAGVEFSAVPEYPVFPPRDSPLPAHIAALRTARATIPIVRSWAPDVVVADILTVSPALAAEVCGVPWASLVPHLLPLGSPGFPPFGFGARLPRTAVGAALWDGFDDVVQRGLRIGRRELNECRVSLGLDPLPWLHTGLSRSLTLVATLDALEYPRDWPPWIRRVGPLLWSASARSAAGTPSPAAAAGQAVAHGAPHAPPTPVIACRVRGTPAEPAAPLVVVAPSTAQDREHRLLRAALRGLAGAQLRVLAVGPPEALDGAAVPPNATLVPWLDYATAMRECDLVICHGGFGTLARALTSGCPVVVCAAAGDMGENAARAAWADVGRRLPLRACTPTTLRLTVRRALADPSLRARAQAVAANRASHTGAADAADALERWASLLAPAGG